MTPPIPSGAAALYARAFHEARAFRPHLAAVLLVGLLGLPITLVLPIPVTLVVDHVLAGHPVPGWLAGLVPAAVAAAPDRLLRLAVLAGACLALLSAAHHYLDWMLRDWLAERMVLDFRGRLLRQGLTLPGGAFERGSQESAHRIQHDAPALQWTALYGIIPMAVALVSLAGVLAVTARIDAALAGVALATAVPVIVLIHLSQTRLRGRWTTVKDGEGAAFAVAQETLAASRLVAAFGREEAETERFLTTAGTAFRQRQRVIRVEGLLTVSLGLASGLGTTAILYLGARGVQAGSLSLGELLLVMGYLAQLYAPLQQIGSHITGQQRALVSAARAFALMDAVPAVTDAPDAEPLARARGHLRLEGVGFRYDPRTPVLAGVGLDIPAGTCVGIVGRTGAGKSTLVNLLMRQIDPTEGRILLDGHDLRHIRLRDLRRQFAVVPQDPTLFSTSIAANIAYGDPDAPIGRIIAAAKQAAAHDFIMALPDGYATRVGERGTRLSGGERQRIAIARAFLMDAPVLVLDEPTSAIDATTEAEILESLDRLMRDRTTFVIAHRLATLRRADLVLRVEGGRVVPDAADPLRLVS
ncbi:ABC transporter ATP-binding protein [Rhodospirillum centenum]|uniref:ABC transporter ATP-binding protein, putative n=1 Tax=Rhodospirillum centenum (strain ATCC 51521 / SW) TaxID=414684 RepID=B6IXV8_RHOCS|nr:ABC transporter ATP-binding protein [Rhodospirillum centenum]ACJ01132.1 ABC transporter ATP-binding protein, putative [Rhodospirillum centenum SW]